MAAARKAAPRNGGGPATPTPRRLPPITVSKFEAALELVEKMVAENTSLFVNKGQAFRDQHRAGSSRPLTAVEAAQLAAAAVDDRTVEDRAAAFQHSEIRAHDDPQPLEVLAAAGVATAPAFMRAARRVVALIEMDNALFEQAEIDDDIDRVVLAAATTLGHLEMSEARARASAALDHFAAAAGAAPGKGLALLAESLWRALEQAATSLGQGMTGASALSSPTGSPASTDGNDAPSFTEPDTPRPSS